MPQYGVLGHTNGNLFIRTAGVIKNMLGINLQPSPLVGTAGAGEIRSNGFSKGKEILDRRITGKITRICHNQGLAVPHKPKRLIQSWFVKIIVHRLDNIYRTPKRGQKGNLGSIASLASYLGINRT